MQLKSLKLLRASKWWWEMLGAVESSSPTEVRLPQLHAPRRSQAQGWARIPHVYIHTVHIQLATQIRQVESTHSYKHVQHQRSHPIFLSGLSGYKVVSGKHISKYVHTLQISPVPGFRYSAQAQGMARQAYWQQPVYMTGPFYTLIPLFPYISLEQSQNILPRHPIMSPVSPKAVTRFSLQSVAESLSGWLVLLGVRPGQRA